MKLLQLRQVTVMLMFPIWQSLHEVIGKSVGKVTCGIVPTELGAFPGETFACPLSVADKDLEGIKAKQ